MKLLTCPKCHHIWQPRKDLELYVCPECGRATLKKILRGQKNEETHN